MRTATLTRHGRSVRLYLRPCLFGGRWTVLTASIDGRHTPPVRETFASQREALGWFLHLLRMFAEET